MSRDFYSQRDKIHLEISIDRCIDTSRDFYSKIDGKIIDLEISIDRQIDTYRDFCRLIDISRDFYRQIDR